MMLNKKSHNYWQILKYIYNIIMVEEEIKIKTKESPVNAGFFDWKNKKKLYIKLIYYKNI